MHRRPLTTGEPPRLWSNGVAALLIGASGWLSRNAFHLEGTPYLLLWLPTGLSIGLLLRCRHSHIPGVLVGLLLACAQASPLHYAVDLSKALTECGLAITLLRRRYWDNDFRAMSDVALMVCSGAILTPLAGSALELSLMQLFSPATLNWSALWMELWANMAGIGLCVPAITLYSSNEWRSMAPKVRLLAAGIVVLGPLALYAELSPWFQETTGNFPFAIILFPLIAWLAVGVSLSAAMLTLLLMSLVLIASTATGTGYFSSGDPLRTALSLDLFISILCLSSLLIGTLQRHRLRLEALTRHALKDAQLALWEWHPGCGLILHDPDWAAHFRAEPGKSVNPAGLVGEVEAATPLGILCDLHEEPLLAENEEQQFRLRLPDGSWRELVCRRLPTPPASAALRGSMNGILLDCTERNRAKRLQEQTLAQEAELKNIKHSIHPHFLFNALNTLRALIASNPADARDFVTRLASFLRNSLNTTQENKVRFGEELTLVRNYLSIEQFRFGERMRLSITIPKHCEAVPFPPMILQTLVENAAKYGISRRPEGGEIRIEASLVPQGLSVTVTNDGPLVPTPPQATGTGLTHIEARLRLLYGNRASLTLREIEGPQVRATVIVPLGA